MLTCSLVVQTSPQTPPAVERKPVYLLTCPDSYAPGLSRMEDELFQLALAAEGIACHRVVWSDPTIKWEGLASEAWAVVIRSAWDYYLDRERFLDVLTRVASRTTLLNSLEVVRWNTHKSYLRDLDVLGLPIMPTLWMQPGMAVDIASYGWRKAVLKPVVATNAFHALLFSHRQRHLAEAHLARCGMEMLLQPFFEEVLSVGEHALVFLAGRYSHAFRKQCALSEEDRQAEHPITAAPAEIRCAGQVLVAIARLLHLHGPEALLFARVDLVPDRRGHYCLMEVELTEPRLRLEDRPTAGDQLTSALLMRLDRSRSASRGT